MADLPPANICFHGIGIPERDLDPGEAPYWISTDQFHSILDEVKLWPQVRISFDDGNASDVQIGLEALLERNLNATFFVLAGRLGAPGSLAEGDVRHLYSRGMLIGTHGMDHRPWRGLDPATRDRELVEARKRISDVIGAPVQEAALPLGRYDRRLLADLRRLGYSAVHTSDRRIARPGSWLQPRFSVQRHDDPQSMRSQVNGTRALGRRLQLEAVGLVKRLR